MYNLFLTFFPDCAFLGIARTHIIQPFSLRVAAVLLHQSANFHSSDVFMSRSSHVAITAQNNVVCNSPSLHRANIIIYADSIHAICVVTAVIPWNL